MSCAASTFAGAHGQNDESKAVLLGVRAVQPAHAQVRPGIAQAFGFKSRRAGRATAVKVYVASGNKARRLMVAVYSAGRCAPAARLTSGSSALLKSKAWNVVSVRPVALGANRTYWLAVMGSGGTLRLRDRELSGCVSLATDAKTAPPMRWQGGAAHNACALSAYAVSAGTAPPLGTTATYKGAPDAPTGVAPIGVAPTGVAPTGVAASDPTAATTVDGADPIVSGPGNTTPPVISGVAVLGNTLTVSNGHWSGSPISYTYQWEDCDTAGNNCTLDLAAISSSYTLSSADVGHTIRAVVTALNLGGVTSATSQQTAVVLASAPPPAPVNSAAPTVSGTAQMGDTLSSSTGAWSNNPTSYAYQWEDCNAQGASCSAISGATSSAYTLGSGDAGDTVRSVVKACNASGCTSATSPQTGVVASGSGGSVTPSVVVAQSAAGSGNGSSCANAESAAWFNTASNWGSGHPIAPGAVVGLCGTISSPLTAHGSGTSGNPITVYWESGASLSEPYCNGPQSSCFDTNGKTYLTLNGGSNGSIQATANGTSLTYQKSSNAIYAEGCTGCTFENLTIANMYVHPDNSAGEADSASATDCQMYCAAIIWNGANVTVENNTVHDVGWALIDFELNSDANTQITANTVYNISHGLALGAKSAGGNIGPVLVDGNSIYGFENWDTSSDSWHNDGIHCYVGTQANGTPPHYNGLYIYNNTLGPGGRSGANFNADIFLEGGTGSGSTPCADSTSPIYVFNNVLSATNDAGCGVNCQYTGHIADYNNTIIGADTTNDGCNVFQDGSGYTVPTSMTFENNATTTCGNEIIARAGSFASGQPNYNLYTNGGSNSFVCGSKFMSFSSFSAWQSCISGDAHSSTASNAMMNASNGSPQAGSPANGAGANLSSLCTGYLVPLCSTISGDARPTSGAWNAGAY